MDIDAMLSLFRQWYQSVFRNSAALDAATFTRDGFDDEVINALWIGFCGGLLWNS